MSESGTQSRMVGCPVVILALERAEVNSDALAEELLDELLTHYLNTDAVHVVLDFREVRYLSSAGFRPLLSLNRRVRERGGRMVLCNLRPEVEEVLHVTRLLDAAGTGRAAFTARPTAAAAVAHVYASEAPAPTSPPR